MNPFLTPRRPGMLQGILLLLPITMAVMGIVVLAPVVPRMETHFAGTRGVQYLVPFALTVPALIIGLLSGPAGMLVDRIGRRKTLIGGLLLYAGIGIIPAFLDDLTAIIVARIALGAMEALILIASTTLIGDYFEGKEREKWIAGQLGLASASAVVLVAIGGALGNISWRAPFFLYLSAIISAALIAMWTWEPAQHAADSNEAAADHFPWRAMLPVPVSAFMGAVVVFALQVQLSVLLTERYGITAPGTIGLFSAAGSLAVPIGTFFYRAIAGWSQSVLLATSLVLIGGTFYAMGVAPNSNALLVLYVISQFGCGILGPTLTVWAVAPLSFQYRGRGTGIFMSGGGSGNSRARRWSYSCGERREACRWPSSFSVRSHWRRRPSPSSIAPAGNPRKRNANGHRQNAKDPPLVHRSGPMTRELLKGLRSALPR